MPDTRTKRGTRRLHLASGEIWRVQAEPLPSLHGDRRMVIVRESDQTQRSVGEDYWLSDRWSEQRIGHQLATETSDDQ